MSLLKKNITANLIGSAWTAIISIAFIPFYIHFMGVESYGLVGFYVTLQTLFFLLDMGLAGAISRELARLSGIEGQAQKMRDLVRTLEIVYWLVSVLVALTITLIASWVATTWLNASQVSPETVQQAIVIMGLVIALRMPYGFYTGALLGLQRQVLLNGIKIVVETLRSGGVVIVLWLVSPSIEAFFLWQALVAVLGTCVIASVLWRNLPKASKRPLFRFALFQDIWRITIGMSLIAILSALLLQIDKLVLSKLISLETLGYYMLASTVAMGLYTIIVPVFSAIYPRLTQMVASQDEKELIGLYHRGCQLMTVIVAPVAAVVAFYSLELLQIWTQDDVVSEYAAPIVSILIVGTAINGMMNLPYALQLAYGWTRLAISLNVISIALIVPAMMLVVPAYGVHGAAMVWVILNIVYLVFGVNFMHRKLLKDEMAEWFLVDVGKPVIAVLLIAGLCYWMMPSELSDAGHLAWICLSAAGSFAGAIFCAPSIRGHIIDMFTSTKNIGET